MVPTTSAGRQWMGSPTTLQKSHHSIYNFNHEIMEIGIICPDLIEKKPRLHQSWAEEPCIGALFDLVADHPHYMHPL
jgi:hypothetical protein